jgi:CheY-like chemotaxis protein
MKCLLVDDEPGIREGLAALLRRRGHDVRTAGDCASARDELGHDFDVVVTDWRLPDGTAASFWSAARCAIVAVSGHPEEVERTPALREVLTKPLLPARLFEVLAALAPAPEPIPAPALPVDVQAAIDAFVGALPRDAEVALHDDGTFVVVEATLPAGGQRAPAPRDGELCWSPRGRSICVRLRLHRDGGPAPPVRVVRAAAAWPAAGDFAVDFHDSGVDARSFAHCTARARAAIAAGRRVQFLNVPPPLRGPTASHGKADDMPMRDPVGPRLHAEFADLWSDP